MNLTKTDLSADIVAKLRQLNIRDVETLLSMVAVPTGLMAIARVLKLSEDAVRNLASRLRSQHQDLEVTAATGPFHAMGHRPPARKSE